MDQACMVSYERKWDLIFAQTHIVPDIKDDFPDPTAPAIPIN